MKNKDDMYYIDGVIDRTNYSPNIKITEETPFSEIFRPFYKGKPIDAKICETFHDDLDDLINELDIKCKEVNNILQKIYDLNQKFKIVYRDKNKGDLRLN